MAVGLAALITAVSGALVAIYSVIKANRNEADNRRAEATAIGLRYLSAALERQGDEIKSQRRRIEALERELSECHRQRDELVRELAAARGGMGR